jgi:Uma2 family endonuclease
MVLGLAVTESPNMSTAERIIPPLQAGQRLTVREFLRRWEAMPDLKFAELIDGVVYMPSPLTSDHGRKDLRVSGWLAAYIAATPGCDAGCQATWLMLKSAPQPDSYLWILPEFGGQSKIEGNYHFGAPELAAEVCLSSAAYDLGVKKALYERAKVREYVAILVQEQQIRWHRLVKGEYQLCRPTRGVFRSKVFPGLWLDRPAVLLGDMARLLQTLQRGLESPAHAAFVKNLAGRAGSGPLHRSNGGGGA